MFDPQSIFEFSRDHCVAICSFLVPANLMTTIATLVLVIRNQPLLKIRWLMGIASVFALILFLHVSTWFIIGVITPVTFILFGLGATCLIINALALIYRQEVFHTVSAKFSKQ